MTFKFQLTENVLVHLRDGPTCGEVIARTEYSNGTPNIYLVDHYDAAGNRVELWHEEGRLDPKE